MTEIEIKQLRIVERCNKKRIQVLRVLAEINRDYTRRIHVGSDRNDRLCDELGKLAGMIADLRGLNAEKHAMLELEMTQPITSQ